MNRTLTPSMEGRYWAQMLAPTAPEPPAVFPMNHGIPLGRYGSAREPRHKTPNKGFVKSDNQQKYRSSQCSPPKRKPWEPPEKVF